MHTSKPFTAAMVSLIAVFASVVAVTQWNRAHHAAAERHQQENHHARLMAQAAALKQYLDQAQRESIRTTFAPSQATEATASTSSAPDVSNELGIGGEMAELIAEHPELLSAHQGRERADFLLEYGPFLRLLNTTQREHFLAELSLGEKRRAAIRITAKRHGLAEDAPQLLSLQQDEAARHAQEFASLLGPADYRRFQEFERTLGVRYLATALAAQLYTTSSPLEAETAERLVQALAPHAADASGKVQRGAVRWADALPDAEKVLTPDQWTLFERLANAQRQQRQLNRIVANSLPDAAP